jgi:hypothetical protein
LATMVEARKMPVKYELRNNQLSLSSMERVRDSMRRRAR